MQLANIILNSVILTKKKIGRPPSCNLPKQLANIILNSVILTKKKIGRPPSCNLPKQITLFIDANKH